MSLYDYDLLSTVIYATTPWQAWWAGAVFCGAVRALLLLYRMVMKAARMTTQEEPEALEAEGA